MLKNRANHVNHNPENPVDPVKKMALQSSWKWNKERYVKSEEEVAEAEIVVVGLFAATVLRDTYTFEPNPAIVHQHCQRIPKPVENTRRCDTGVRFPKGETDALTGNFNGL